MRTYHPGSKDQLVQGNTREDDSSSTRPLNFRLQVKTDATVGTWSVWNLERRGDCTVVPLLQTPLARPAQVKIGFDEGIILRIPHGIGLELTPRLVYEIGFWHNYAPHGRCRIQDEATTTTTAVTTVTIIMALARYCVHVPVTFLLAP
jgi:hypothetical protein